MPRLKDQKPDRRKLLTVYLPRSGRTINHVRLQEDGRWRYPGGYYTTTPDDEWEYEEASR